MYQKLDIINTVDFFWELNKTSIPILMATAASKGPGRSWIFLPRSALRAEQSVVSLAGSMLSWGWEKRTGLGWMERGSWVVTRSRHVRDRPSAPPSAVPVRVRVGVRVSGRPHGRQLGDRASRQARVERSNPTTRNARTEVTPDQGKQSNLLKLK